MKTMTTKAKRPLQAVALVPALIGVSLLARAELNGFDKVAFDHRPLRVVDEAPGRAVALSPLAVKGTARYRFYAKCPGRVSFEGRLVEPGGASSAGMVTVARERYRLAPFEARLPIDAAGGRQAFVIDVPEAGFYSLEAKTGDDAAFVLLSSEVPVAIVGEEPFGFRRARGDLWFAVREKRPFGVCVAGSGQDDRISAELSDPSGRVAWSRRAVLERETFKGAGQDGALWRLRLDAPASGVHGDAAIGLGGDVPEWFPSKAKYWHVQAANPPQKRAEKPGQVARPDLVRRVMAGELRTARASWWGFDPTNATAYLQAAIDSRVPHLVVDRRPADWNVTTLFGVSGQTIELEAGVEIVAMKGAFANPDDVLFHFGSCTNSALVGHEGSALRMRRSDYHDKTRYLWSEWRHAVNLLAVCDFRLEGLAVVESGGDGLYLGVDWGNGNTGPCRNVTVRNCVFDRNYRQGISVISANGLLIEDTVMRNTWGTQPAAGIDFEPNRPCEEIVNCVMRNCRSENNQSSGYEMYTENFGSNSLPIDVTFENCRGAGNFNNFYYLHHAAEKNGFSYPRGRLTLKGCTFERGRWRGAQFLHAPACGIEVVMHDCRFADNCSSDEALEDIGLVQAPDTPPTDGILLDNVSIRRRRPGDWLTRCGSNLGLPENVRGVVRLEQPGGETTTVVLDERWRKSYFRKPAKP